MKLHEFASNYYHKGFINFNYVSPDSGFATVKDADNVLWEQFLFLDDGKFKFGDIKQVENNLEPVIEEDLDTSLNIRMPKSMKDSITEIAKIRGMKASEYVRVLITNDILREKKEKEQGYVII